MPRWGRRLVGAISALLFALFVAILANVISPEAEGWLTSLWKGGPRLEAYRFVAVDGVVCRCADGKTVVVEPFAIGVHEVTHGQAVGELENHPSPWEGVGDDDQDAVDHEALPAVGVTVPQAKRVCARLGGRLPTRLEWLVAAALVQSDRPWSEMADLYGHFDSKRPRPAAQGRQNVSGTRNMLGNVAEWTDTVYPRDRDCAPPRIDPVGSSLSAYSLPGLENTLYWVQGGSFANRRITAPTGGVDDLSASQPATTGDVTIGFRCVRD